jgi:hypothetical protein
MYRPLLVVAFGLPLFGCSVAQRVRECRKLGATVNPELQAIETRAQKHTPADYRAVAQSYTSLASRVRALTPHSQRGKQLIEEYANVFDAAAGAVSGFAQAVDRSDARQLEEANRTLERTRRREQSVVARIDAYCQSP